MKFLLVAVILGALAGLFWVLRKRWKPKGKA